MKAANTIDKLKATINKGMDITILAADKTTADFTGHVTQTHRTGALISGRWYLYRQLASLYDIGCLQIHHAGMLIKLEEERISEEELAPADQFSILPLDQYPAKELELLLQSTHCSCLNHEKGETKSALDVWCYRIRDAFKAAKKREQELKTTTA